MNSPIPTPVARGEILVYLIAGLMFAGAAVLTFSFVRNMSGGMTMPGRWTMSMMWMLMPGQTLLAAALVFAVMWLAMMIAMMLPSALPMLLLYLRTVTFRGEPRGGILLWLVGGGYFAVWLLFGLAAYGIGLATAKAAMASEAVSRAIPFLSGIALACAGGYQMTPWKSACLKHCRDPFLLVARYLHHGWRGALGLGLHHGAFCAACCWGLMLIQLVLGVMNVTAMIVVAAVIGAEKLLARGERIAHATGVLAIVVGAAVILRSIF